MGVIKTQDILLNEFGPIQINDTRRAWSISTVADDSFTPAGTNRYLQEFDINAVTGNMRIFIGEDILSFVNASGQDLVHQSGKLGCTA